MKLKAVLSVTTEDLCLFGSLSQFVTSRVMGISASQKQGTKWKSQNCLIYFH